MTMNQKLAGISFGRIVFGSAIVLLMASAPPFFAPAAWAGDAGYIRVIGAQGALDGGSKEAAHLNWIAISSVAPIDLNTEVQADRESSAPSVSELTATPSGAGSGKAEIGSNSSGSGAGKIVAQRDAASGMATGKRMHKPFTITKEVDSASPLLTKACASGQHFKEVDIDLGSGARYKLTDAVIASDAKSSGGDRPMETISFTYQKIEMTR